MEQGNQAQDERRARKVLVLKVFITLIHDVLTLLFFGLLGLFLIPFRRWIVANSLTSFYITTVSLGIAMLIALLLMCKEKVRRFLPFNYCLYHIYVLLLCLAYLFLTVKVEASEFFSGFLTTIAVFIFLSMVSYIPKLDLTRYHKGLSKCQFICIVIVEAAFLRAWGVHKAIILGSIGAGMFGVSTFLYITLYMQLVIGGRKTELPTNDYIEGYIAMYTSFVGLVWVTTVLFGRFVTVL